MACTVRCQRANGRISLFLFLGNLLAEGIFLVSLHLQRGCGNVRLAAAAVLFSVIAAVGSVLLEWFWPVRGWKIEGDLRHHPRKYVVPAAVLLLSGLLSILFL